jgi:hypothetical protein
MRPLAVLAAARSIQPRHPHREARGRHPLRDVWWTAVNEPTPTKRHELAKEADQLAQTWLDRVASQPPQTEQERQQFRQKAAEFRQLAESQRTNLADACRKAADVVAILQQTPEPSTVLRGVGAVLDGEAATARTLALVLEVCDAIDRVT